MNVSADKAVLRLSLGVGLAVLIAYGWALPMPYMVCLMSVLVLCKPGPPIPFLKAVVIALVLTALLAAGALMVAEGVSRVRPAPSQERHPPSDRTVHVGL